MGIHEKYDVLIAGGGLAGLTLALQLKQARPDISILVLEKRAASASSATHKVGESLSELGSSYLRVVLNLKDYLNEQQLPKFGFRFFFSPEHRDDISRRVEVGSKISDPYPSHQVDRGLLENELVKRLLEYDVEVVLGAKVIDVRLSKTGHELVFEKEQVQCHIKGTWIVDSTGRNGLLKRKLSLEKEINHDINAAWFRLNAVIDIDDWSENLAWRKFVDPGRRRLATNHLVGEGYWIWIIPLVSGKTSIGIVADPRYHSFLEYNNFEKGFKWMEKHEPLAAKMLSEHKEHILDFKVMKHLAYDSKQFYSTDRWALTGDAGAFMDPLYSPGIDFIALGNSWITELIVCDISGKDTALQTLIYDLAHKELLNGWINLYKNMYGVFGKTQVMLMKIAWDWACYWAIPNVIFMNKGYTNVEFLKQYSSSNPAIGKKFASLNVNMQQLFGTWAKYDVKPCRDHQQNVFDLKCLREFHRELGTIYKPGELLSKVQSNLKILELIGAEIFRLVSSSLHDTPGDMQVDPYEMKIDEGKDELLRRSHGQDALAVDEGIRSDISGLWLQKIKILENELV